VLPCLWVGSFADISLPDISIFLLDDLPTSPSSGQAAISFQLRLPKLPACHSRAAFEGCVILDESQQGGVAR